MTEPRDKERTIFTPHGEGGTGDGGRGEAAPGMETPKLDPAGWMRAALRPEPGQTARKAAPVPGKARQPRARSALNGWLIIWGILLLFAAAAIWIVALPHRESGASHARPKPVPAQIAARSTIQVSAAKGGDRLRNAVALALPGIACSWLDIERLDPTVTLSGVAGDASAVAAALSQAFAGNDLNAPIDVSDVASVDTSACKVLDAFRAVRAPGGDSSIRAAQPAFHLQQAPQDCPAEPFGQAEVVIDFYLPGQGEDFSLVGMNNRGQMVTIVSSRNDFLDNMTKVKGWDDLGGGHYHWTICTGEQSARQSPVLGLLLVTGRAPLDFVLPHGNSGSPAAVSRAWLAGFESRAREGGWNTQMTWYRVDAE